jgi:signal transduction histidine kinase/CheY-like chemotaxis protein
MHPQDLDSPKYAELMPYRIQQLQKNGQIQFETEYIRRDDGTIPTEIQANLVEYDGKPAIISVARDVTDRKRGEAEKEVLEAKLRRLKKMKAIGLMAGGVAHDLNNILSGIISYPELLLMQLPEKSELRESVIAIQQSGLRAAAVVDDLLTVARGVASTKKIANLNTLIIEYLNSQEYRELSKVHPFISFNKELAPDLLNISCSAVHITKCLMNLVTNAAEAIDRVGRIIVATRNQYIDKPVSSKEFMDKGEYVVLCITDTGSGISNHDLEHIFEPFYSKKVMGRSGTGLGLAVVWNTMQDHNGTITVNSNDSGTTFELYFPATRDNVLGREKNIQIDNMKGNGEQVLIVDDELQQQDIAKKTLKSMNYRVYSVSSGEKAVQFLQKESVDLLILDMIMDPGMNGLETYKQIIKIHPGQKAIIASGFSKSKDVQETLQLGAGLFIKKPYTLEQLGRAVQKELKR